MNEDKLKRANEIKEEIERLEAQVMNLAYLERESDKRTQALLDKATEQEVSNFNAEEHLSIKVMPYQDDEMIFRQQGRRVSWGKKNAKYVAARHYPNTECAKEIIDELIGLGANVEMQEGQTGLF